MLKYEILDTSETWIAVSLIYTVFYKLMTPKKYTISMGIFLASLSALSYYLIMYSQFDIFLLSADKRTEIFLFSVLTWFLLSVFAFAGFYDSARRKLRIIITGICLHIISKFLTSFAIIRILNTDTEMLKTAGGKYAVMNSASVFAAGILIPVLTYWLCREKVHEHSYKIKAVTVCLSFSAVFFFLITVSYYQTVLENEARIILFFICLFFIVLFLNSMRAFIRYSVEAEKIRSDVSLTQQMQTLTVEKLKESCRNDKKIHMIKHDYLDQLMCIKLLIDRNTEESLSRAEDIIDSLSGEINSFTPAVFSSNLSLNIILSGKIAEAAKREIKIIPEISVPESFPHSQERDIDLLMINLLDNAIEGCMRNLPGTVNTIRFSVVKRGNFLFIKTENPCDKTPVRVRGRFVTSKKDTENHGIGNTIIESIVQRQNGRDDIINENGSFIRSVCIELE